MKLILNYLAIAGIAAILVYAIKRWLKSSEIEDYDELEEEEISISFLIQQTSLAFARTLKKNINEDNLSKEEILRKERRRTALRQAVTNAGYGDETAKRVVKNNIKELLMDEKYGITEKTIDNIIPFSDVNRLKGNDMFEAVLYAYNKQFGHKGCEVMFEEWGVAANYQWINGEYVVKFTTDMIRYIYKAVFINEDENEQSKKLGHVELDFNDKIELIAQRIFELKFGMGMSVDMLFETTLDGIDVGVSGIPDSSFKARTEQKNLPYSYESIWVMYHGLKIHLMCCSLESQAELVRVTNNVYKYNASGVLSRNNPKIVGTMITGSRVTANRLPFSDSYAFNIRKFDSAEALSPSRIITGENNVIPIVVMKWALKGLLNSIITGAQATGKTTLLKSLARFINPMLSIRTSENRPELNLRYTYPNRNIEAFYETDSVSMQEGIDYEKKTNADVNIQGEIADAVQASYFIQTTMVGSLLGMGTHHANTTEDLVEGIANDLLRLGLYKDINDAVRLVSKQLNIDCAVVNVKGNRHISHITEVIPLKDQLYPSQQLDGESLSGEDAMYADAAEYMHRTTNPKLYTTSEIVTWMPLTDENGSAIKDAAGRVKGKFILANMPSPEMIEKIKIPLTVEEEAEFDRDFEMLRKISAGERSEEVIEWEKTALEC